MGMQKEEKIGTAVGGKKKRLFWKKAKGESIDRAVPLCAWGREKDAVKERRRLRGD